MSKEKKKNRVYRLDTEQIKTRLRDLGERCVYLADMLQDDGAESLQKEDRSLIRFAYVGMLRTHFSEATYCVMAGDLEHAFESLTHAQALIEQLP
jgi:hypothetical protein